MGNEVNLKPVTLQEAHDTIGALIQINVGGHKQLLETLDALATSLDLYKGGE